MKKLYIMIGLPGSGKSTYTKDLEGKVFSSDQYREKISGNSSDQSCNEQVFKKIYSDMREAMCNNIDCIFDATNCTYKSRTQAISLGKKFSYEIIGIVVCQTIEKCIEQDSNRSRSVGKNVILKYAKSFQFPQYLEGFDSIKIVRPGFKQKEYGKSTLHFLSHELFEVLKPQLDNFEQHNPHHDFTVGKHSDLIADKAMKDYISGDISMEDFAVLLPAGLWHDCGKIYTQTFDENNVAHYYGHESISVLRLLDIYSKMCDDTYDKNTVFKILFVINNHMRFRDICKSEKASKKFIMKWGQRNYDLLKRFIRYDEESCKKSN